ncbi:hypothetical protein CU097_007882 [Rhizopus azygosporus]|uniref:SLH domain-containing protein n=1 Tax=Rhizopus azygosporus TaxID=86630 RepID=A0A367J8U2_RHIAZ|nr:hypothetical protein CU097_007882 [Rhizopus azygosporus]
MAIGLSGLATLLFGTTFPQFDPQVNQSNTDKFKTNATSFFIANEDRPAVDDNKYSSKQWRAPPKDSTRITREQAVRMLFYVKDTRILQQILDHNISS